MKTYEPRQAENIGNNIEALLQKSEKTFEIPELIQIKEDVLQQAQNFYDLTGRTYSIKGSEQTLFRLANVTPQEKHGDTLTHQCCSGINPEEGQVSKENERTTGETYQQNKFYDEPHEVVGFGD